jgi:hypothetical protein
MTNPVTYTGDTAVCPVGLILGYDGDGCRANLLSDGRILSGLNGVSHPIPDAVLRRLRADGNHTLVPDGIRKVVAALISGSLKDETLTLVSISNQLDDRDISAVGAALAAHGVDASALDNTRVVLNAGSCLQTLVITYNGDVEAALAGRSAGSDEQGILNRDETKRAPACISLAADKLIAAGFHTVGASFDGASLRTITFTRGDGSRLVRAELTWIV